MGFRFWRRMRIAPGISLNLSKSGASLSLGPRGAHVTIGPHGARTTVGIPGTGLSYSTHSGAEHHAASPPPAPAAPSPAVRPEDKLHMGFFDKLFASDEEKTLVEGLREAAAGREDEALPLLDKEPRVADAMFMAGVIRMKKNDYEAAAECLEKALTDQPHLNQYIKKYGITAVVSLPIAAGYVAHVGPNEQGVRLMLAEIYRQIGAFDTALACLDRLVALEPNDLVLRLARIEVMLDRPAPDQDTCRAAVEAAKDVTNASPVHAALLLYKAKALRLLGLFDASAQVLGQTLKKTKDRPPELLQALLYERALAFGGKGNAARARADLETLYAQNPHYEDVAHRLGLDPAAPPSVQ